MEELQWYYYIICIYFWHHSIGSFTTNKSISWIDRKSCLPTLIALDKSKVGLYGHSLLQAVSPRLLSTSVSPNKMDVPSSTNGALSVAESDFISIIGSLLEDLAQEPRESPSAIAELKMRAAELMKESHSLLQIVFRTTCLRILKNISVDCDSAKVQNRISLVLRLVDYSNELAKTDVADMVLPSSLLEYVFSLCTLKQIEASLSSIRERLTTTAEIATSRKLDLLKAALLCIRRDNAAVSPQFSGRLHVMLASALPLWSPSGLNKKGVRNTDNVLKLANEQQFNEALKSNDEQKDPPNTNLKFPLYETFWSLQKTIAQPFESDNLSESWSAIRTSFNEVLFAFERTNVVAGNPAAFLSARFPKYLTDPCVFHIQFADIEWRRQVLTQFLVFLQYLKTVGDDREMKNNPEKALWDKNQLICKKLFARDGEGRKLCIRIMKLLASDDPDAQYCKHVAQLLDNEVHWINWKLTNACSKLDRKRSGSTRPFSRKRRKLSTVDSLTIDGDKCLHEKSMPGMLPTWVRRQKSFKAEPVSSVMSVLEKRTLPEIETSKEVRKALESDHFEPDEELKLKNDPKFRWQSLRAMCLTDMKGMLQVMDESAKFCVNFEKLKNTQSPNVKRQDA